MSIDIEPTPTEALEHAQQAECPPLLPSEGSNPEYEQSPWLRARKVARYVGKTVAAAVFAAVPVGSAVIAIEAAPPAHVDLAGQDATIEPVIGKNYTTIDGMLNRQDHFGSHGLEMGANIDANLLSLLFPPNQADKQAATQLVQDPKPEIDRLQHAARDQVLLWGGGGLVAGATLEAGYWLTRRGQRKKFAAGTAEYQQHVLEHNRSRNRREAALAVAGVGAVLATSSYIIATPDHHTVRPSAVFAGTPFAGTEEISGAADKIGPVIHARYSPEQARFYDKTSEHIQAAAINIPALAERKPGTTRLLIGDDIQYVQGMARILGTSAKAFNVDGTLYLGDWTDSDSDVESFILDTFLYYAGGRDMLSMAGLHDTDNILEAEAARDGITLAQNSVEDYEGLKILALNDPRVSTLNRLGMLFNDPWRLRDADTSIDDFVNKAVDTICSDKPQIMALHDNKLGKRILHDALARDCDPPITFDGRSYVPLGLQTYSSPTGSQSAEEYTTGSSGGHRGTGLSFGIIGHDAFEAVVDIDPDENTITIHPITIGTDSHITVGTALVRPWETSATLTTSSAGHTKANAAAGSKK